MGYAFYPGFPEWLLKLSLELLDAPRFIRILDIHQVMSDERHLFLRRFGGAYVHISVDLHGVGGDDFQWEEAGQFHSETGFARSGRACDPRILLNGCPLAPDFLSSRHYTREEVAWEVLPKKSPISFMVAPNYRPSMRTCSSAGLGMEGLDKRARFLSGKGFASPHGGVTSGGLNASRFQQPLRRD